MKLLGTRAEYHGVIELILGFTHFLMISKNIKVVTHLKYFALREELMSSMYIQ